MKLALGTAQFGLDYGVANSHGKVPFSEIQRIIYLASEIGIDTFDTASLYGESEEILGKLSIQGNQIISKLSESPRVCRNIDAWVVEEVNKSLDRLKTDKIYGLLLHRPQQLLAENGEKLYDALNNLKLLGKVKKIGISVYNPKELGLIWKKFTFDIVQAPLNILDRRIVESGWAEELSKQFVKLQTRSTFLQGLLLMTPDQRPRFFNKWNHIFDIWDDWLDEVRLSPLEACLRYVINQSKVDRVIVGVNSVKHLQDINNALGPSLSSLPEFNFFNDDLLLNPSNWKQL